VVHPSDGGRAGPVPGRPIIFFQIYFSLHQWTAYLGDWWEADFVGLDNFAEVLRDPRFYWSLIRSLIFAGGSTVLCLVIGFTLAYLMRDPFPGRGLLYLLFITPMLIVPIAIGYNFEMLLVEKGPLNQVLGWLTGRGDPGLVVCPAHPGLPLHHLHRDLELDALLCSS
jgi:ABC-type sugar transport system permease subunit